MDKNQEQSDIELWTRTKNHPTSRTMYEDEESYDIYEMAEIERLSDTPEMAEVERFIRHPCRGLIRRCYTVPQGLFNAVLSPMASVPSFTLRAYWSGGESPPQTPRCFQQRPSIGRCWRSALQKEKKRKTVFFFLQCSLPWG